MTACLHARTNQPTPPDPCPHSRIRRKKFNLRPLTEAAIGGHWDVVAHLANSGADTRPRIGLLYEGMSDLDVDDISAPGGRWGVVGCDALTLACNSSRSADDWLHASAAMQAVKALLEAGATVRGCWSDGPYSGRMCTQRSFFVAAPLVGAVCRDNRGAATALCLFGKGRGGATDGLVVAIAKGRADWAALLLLKGADAFANAGIVRWGLWIIVGGGRMVGRARQRYTRVHQSSRTSTTPTRRTMMDAGALTASAGGSPAAVLYRLAEQLLQPDLDDSCGFNNNDDCFPNEEGEDEGWGGQSWKQRLAAWRQIATLIEKQVTSSARHGHVPLRRRPAASHSLRLPRPPSTPCAARPSSPIARAVAVAVGCRSRPSRPLRATHRLSGCPQGHSPHALAHSA